MAERTSTRTASRRTTPQPASYAPRTTRATRSQSRDISDSDAGVNGMKARRQRTKVSSESADDAAGQSNLKRQKGRPAIDSRALKDLSTVLEDANVVYPDLRSNGNSEREQALESGEKFDETQAHSKSPGGISVFSGTTARTSRSAQELSLLSSEDMMDAFEDLTRYSDKLLGFLIPSEISEASVTALMAQLQTKGSRANKTLTRLVTMFSVQRDRYGSDSYILHEEILRTLLGKRHISDREIGQWRPDALLQKANLAALAFSILSRPWQNRDPHLVEELEHVFPMPFALGYVAPENMQVGYSVLQRETFELALELRTQYAITLLAHHATRPNFDSDVILQQLFYKDAHKLRGWSVLGLQSGELTEKFQEAIVSRLEAIRGAFNTFSENAFKSVELLGISFPWVSLVPRAVRWASQRLAELESQISANGGFDGIFKALVDEIQRTNLNNSFSKGDANDDRIPQIVLDYDVPSEASNALPEPQNKRKSATSSILKLGQFNVNSPIAKKAVASLKRIEASRKAALESEPISRQQDQPTASDIQVTATAGPSTRALSPQKDTGSVVPSSASAKITDQKAAEPPQDDSLRPQEMDDEDELIMTDSVSHLKEIGRQVFSRQAKQQAESNKENIECPMAQVEPQSGIRQKRRFIDRQPNAQRVEFDNTQESDGNFQPSQIEDVSEDEGFRTSHQIVNVAARRRLKPSQEHPASQPTRPQGPARKRARIQETGPPGTLDVIPDRMNDEPSPSSLLEVYKVANSAAKERTNLQPRLPQIRRPWSDEETSQLLDLIEDHGISWSLLKKEDQEGGGLLQDRDQVALKDKARNMKVDYLRAGQMLPKNFELIAISKLQIDRLRAVGIVFDPETGQREDALVENQDT